MTPAQIDEIRLLGVAIGNGEAPLERLTAYVDSAIAREVAAALERAAKAAVRLSAIALPEMLAQARREGAEAALRYLDFKPTVNDPKLFKGMCPGSCSDDTGPHKIYCTVDDALAAPVQR